AGLGSEPQLAMAEYHALRGDMNAALVQLQQVLNNPRATPHETARASVRREQLERELERLAREWEAARKTRERAWRQIDEGYPGSDSGPRPSFSGRPARTGRLRHAGRAAGGRRRHDRGSPGTAARP